jgi:hypothetical protein
MANKAFEIQESKLRIGGLDLEAGATAIVVPGLSQAVTYFVEEVDERDGNNPSTFGNDAGAVKVIDNSRYLVLSGTTPGSLYVPAEYSVDELDDGEIEEIVVDVDGVFEAADKTRAESENMWAIVSADPYTNFIAGDWTRIPFRPKMRADEVTNVGGGGASSLEDLDDVQIDDPTDGQVLAWNTQREQWENQNPSVGNVDLSNYQAGSDGIRLESNEAIVILSDGITGIDANSTILKLYANNTILEWNGDDLKLPAGTDITRDDGTGNFISVLGGNANTGNVVFDGNQLYVGGTGFLNLENADDQVEIGSNNEGPLKVSVNEGDKAWYFNIDGTLELPAGGDIVDSNGDSVLGGGSGSSTVVRQDTPPTASNGTLWFNTVEGRLYIKYSDVWVDAAPLVQPLPDSDIDVNSITFPDATVLTSANALTPDRLVNGDNELILGTDGTLTFPSGNLSIGSIQGFETILASANTNIGILAQGETGTITLLWSEDGINPDEGTNTAAVIVSGEGSDAGAVQIWTGATGPEINVWKFNPDGSTTFPNQYVNSRTYNADALVFTKNGTQKAISTQPGNVDNNTVERLVIAGGDSFYDDQSTEWVGEGGDVYLWAGQGGNGGDLKLDAGNSLGLNGEIGGWIKMRGGDSASGNGGYLELAGGDGNVNGGNVTILGGTGTTGVDGKVRIGTNVAYVNSTPVPVNVWDFGADGSLTFPSGAGFTVGDSGQLKTNDGTTASLDFRDTSGRGFYTNGDGFSLRGNGSNTWMFGTNGTLTLPSSNYLETVDSNLKVVSQGTVTIRSNAAINLTTHSWNFGADGDLTFPDTTVQTTAFNDNTAVTKVSSSWNVATGTGTYTITVPQNGVYQLWVRGNIPNGIIAYLATVSVTNTNVPVLGSQRAWNYTGGGSPILLTSMPAQIIGAEGTISTATVSGTVNNVFEFGIDNTSGSVQTVYWGYTKLS